MIVHNNGIIHRDLKPQNILFDKNFKAKIGNFLKIIVNNTFLADFGVSLMIDTDDKVNKCVGTYHFMCPEAGNNSKNGFSGKRADIWALGVTLFAFIFKSVPFDGSNVLEINDNIENQK